MFVTETLRHPGGVAVLAKVTGDYDKTGLPDPLELRFYFTLAGLAIAQLIVIPAKRPRSRKRRNAARPRRRSVKKIVVIGTGRMGGAFATAFAKRTSHAVAIRGSHAGSSSAAALSRQLGVQIADDKELLVADVVFVATPPAALDNVAAALKGYEIARMLSGLIKALESRVVGAGSVRR